MRPRAAHQYESGAGQDSKILILILITRHMRDCVNICFGA